MEDIAEAAYQAYIGNPKADFYDLTADEIDAWLRVVEAIKEKLHGSKQK